MNILPVDIRRGDHHYDILVGDLLPGRWLEEIEARAKSDKYFAVIDARAAAAHDIPARLAGRRGWRITVLPGGEDHKKIADYAALCESLIADGVDRRSVVAAIGGGVVGDLAGFAAATILRGVRLAQVPTTLLAQVDSSVGGKTGINLAGGKNLLGAFQQPEVVIIDPGFLATLPEREFRAGMAELVKHGIIADRDFFDRLAASAGFFAKRDPAFLAEAVAHSCRMKADIVGGDERESGRRALLNYGHTFGHVLETLAGYDGSLIHGEAVGVGMALAAKFAADRGMIGRNGVQRIVLALRRLGIPVCLDDLPQPLDGRGDWRKRLTADAILAAMLKDKKAASAGLTLILPADIGDCRARPGVPAAAAAAFMLEALAESGEMAVAPPTGRRYNNKETGP